MRRGVTTTIFTVLLVLGICLLLYPSFSNWYNEGHQSKVIGSYTEAVAALSDEERESMLEEAQEYNKKLESRGYVNFTLSQEEEVEYRSLLNLEEVMGYIEIPTIRVELPIYHGTSDAALQSGVGHVAGSSLPVGGEGTHCVLSGHRGLPSSKLFTDLDQLTTGDVFIITVLDQVITYEVDQILIVEPDDTSALGIVEGEDLCTLVTCTPYGINTQRLLVRGHRIANLTDLSGLTGDGSQIEPILVAPFAGIPVLGLMLYWVLRRPKDAREAEDAAAESAEKTGLAGLARRRRKKKRKRKGGLLTRLRRLFGRAGPEDDETPEGSGLDGPGGLNFGRAYADEDELSPYSPLKYSPYEEYGFAQRAGAAAATAGEGGAAGAGADWAAGAAGAGGVGVAFGTTNTTGGGAGAPQPGTRSYAAFAGTIFEPTDPGFGDVGRTQATDALQDYRKDALQNENH